MDTQHINEESTSIWLSRREVKAETESEIIATQDQALQIEVPYKKTIKN
jgi:hypothetical protein